MKTSDEKPIMRDRTYRKFYDGDYIDQKQYLSIAISLFFTHFLMELFYLWVGCLPMALINIASILAYVVSAIIILRGNTMITVWIMILEVYLHVVFACVFMGVRCGYQLWLFGTLASIFLPFFSPNLSKLQKRQIGVFSLIIIVTFIVLTAFDSHGVLPTKYNVDQEIAKAMYYFNAVLGFGAVILYTAIYNTRMNLKNLELQQAADHDFLTGIFNRQRMQKILDAEVLREQDMSVNNLSVAIADIDFFKKINDTYGHVIGDEALKELADIFRSYGENGMLYGRWGGEEFLLIAPEGEHYSQFAKQLESIRKQVEEHEFTRDGKTVKFTVSIGAATYEKGMTVENLVNLADDRLYQAKETGRNKIVYM